MNKFFQFDAQQRVRPDEHRCYSCFCRYGDVVIEAVLGDLPLADDRASNHIVEARLLYRDWIAFWNRHESFAQSQVRAGWVNTIGLAPARGRTTRISRLSLDGVTDVTNDETWLDAAVARLFEVDNLPWAFMPGGEEYYNGRVQDTTTYLIVSDSADFWQTQANPTEESKEETEGSADGMEIESAAHGLNTAREDPGVQAARLLVNPVVSGSINQ